MCAPSAPPAPDYAAQAAQQGVENRDTAWFNTNLNRANQTGPYGSVTWSLRPGADPENPQAGDFTQTTTLSPEQQGLLDSTNRIAGSFLDTAEAGLGRVSDAMGQKFSTAGLPQLGQVQGPYGMQFDVQPTGVQGALDKTGLPALETDVGGARDRVVQAVLSRGQSDLGDQESQMRNKLLNSGIEVGTNAWNSEMQRLDRAKNDLAMQAELTGSNVADQLLARQQAARGQAFGESATAGSFANTAAGQRFQQALQSGNFSNTAAGQLFQQLMAQTQANNQVRQQGIQEQAYLRSLPINEINALRTGNQVQMPQFQNYYTGGNAQAAPVMDAALAQGNYNNQMYQGQMGGYNGLLGGLARLGSAAIPFML